MRDDHPADRSFLSSDDWGIPLTEEFVRRVRTGVRRRRIQRAATVTAAVVAGVGLLGVLVTGLTGPGPGPADGGPTVPVTTAAERPLNGLVIGYLPPGLRMGDTDGSYTAAVGPDGPRNDGPLPSPGEPRADIASRRLESVTERGWKVSITVLRPVAASAAEPVEPQAAGWLLDWARQGLDPVATIDVPIGQAYVLEFRGEEVTTTTVVIAGSDGSVVLVEANASVSRQELERVAHGLSRR